MPWIVPSAILAPSRHWTGMETTYERRRPGLADSVPPETFFVGSAVFHYLGPAFAVLLFARETKGRSLPE